MAYKCTLKQKAISWTVTMIFIAEKGCYNQNRKVRKKELFGLNAVYYAEKKTRQKIRLPEKAALQVQSFMYIQTHEQQSFQTKKAFRWLINALTCILF